MKHIDKQTIEKRKRLEHYYLELEQHQQNKKRDTALLIFLVIIGFSGLCYTFTQASPNYETDYSDFDEISASLAQTMARPKKTKAIIQATTYPSRRARKHLETLLIRGSKETHRPIKFIIDSFDDHAEYTLHFGNGKRRQVNKKQIVYYYQKPGKYRVRLNATFNGETRNIYTGHLEIADNLEFATGAEFGH